MARNTIHVDAPAEAVFEVLSDPRLYGNWVVGATSTRDFEGRWPEAGSVLHHTQMLLLRDATRVLESRPARRLILEAGARPLAVTRVDITLEPSPAGTKVIFDEWATGGLLAALPGVVGDTLLELRNRVTIIRLKRLAELGLRLGES